MQKKSRSTHVTYLMHTHTHAVVEALLGRVAKLPPETLVYCGHEVKSRFYV